MNKKKDEIIIAHRGESFLAPENTLAAIKLAWKNGAIAVEIDVQLTRDNEIVVIHDKTTKRTGNCKKTIRKSNLKELRNVDVGAFKGNQWKGELIPTLSEVFLTVPDNCKLVIEIKSGREIIPKLVTEIKQSKLTISQIEIISFDLNVLTEIKDHIPAYKMLWLLNLDYYLPAWMLWINKKEIIRKVIKGQLNGINVWAGKALNKKLIQLFKTHNLLVYTWTTNDPETAIKLIKMGVDAITTDRPAWLKTQLINV